MTTATVRLLTGLAMIVGAGAARADLPAVLPIDRVTVYREGAVVTRVGSVSLPAGSTRLVIPGLPAGLDPKTLHVAVNGAAVRMGGIEIEHVNEGQFVSDAERELRRRIDTAADRRGAVQDAAATAQLQLKFLESLAANPGAAQTKSGVDAAALGGVIRTLGIQAAAARKEVRDAQIALRSMDRDLERLKADLAKIETQSRQSTALHTAVDAPSPVAATVTVSYSVPDAGWTWIYEARLDSVKKRVTLERQGQVRQGSGEDWKNVELTLTTALPAGDIATPTLGSEFVNLEDPLPARNAILQRRQTLAAAELPAAAPAADMALVTVSAKRRTAREETTEYVADYRIPDRVTLPADRDPRLYAIADDIFDVELTDRVVQGTDPAAHLEAAFRYAKDTPLAPGQLQLYRDGAYVGEAATQPLLAGAMVHMPFGIDDRVHVEVHDEPTQSGEHGLLNKLMVQETRRRFDVTSHHPMAIAVEILDRVPVSQNADVHVEILKGATPPTDRDVDGAAGVLLWRFEAAPQKTVSIHQAYAVEYPKDRQIVATN